jgi:hypothetical protein
MEFNNSIVKFISKWNLSKQLRHQTFCATLSFHRESAPIQMPKQRWTGVLLLTIEKFFSYSIAEVERQDWPDE